MQRERHTDNVGPMPRQEDSHDAAALAFLFELPDHLFPDCADWKCLSPVTENEGGSDDSKTAKLRRGKDTSLLTVLSVGRSQFRDAVIERVCPQPPLLTSPMTDADAGGDGTKASEAVKRLQALFQPDAKWYPFYTQDSEEAPRRLLTTQAHLLLCGPSFSTPAQAAAVYDFAVVEDMEEAALSSLSFVAIEPDLAFMQTRAALLRRYLSALTGDSGDNGLQLRAEIWTSRENAHAFTVDEKCKGAPGGCEDLARLLQCVRKNLAAPSPPLWSSPPDESLISPHKKALNEALRRSEVIALDMQTASLQVSADVGDASRSRQLLLPWAVALQRHKLREKREQDTNLGAPLLCPMPESSTALPGKEVPLFGAVVFSPSMRSGYAQLHGGVAILPEVVLAFINAKGAPTFKFDDEALEVVVKLVPALRAAVAVYDEGQRTELARRLETRKSEQDTQSLSASIFVVERCLRLQYARSFTSDDAERATPPIPSASFSCSPSQDETMPELADGNSIECFLKECRELKVWPFDVQRVLSRNGPLSSRPVPPISEIIKQVPVAAAEGKEMSGSPTTDNHADVEMDFAVVYEPSPFPQSFLSFALAQMTANGVDKCEGIALDVCLTMRRLISRE